MAANFKLTKISGVIIFEPSVFNLVLLAKNIYLDSLSNKIVIVLNPLTNIKKISEFYI